MRLARRETRREIRPWADEMDRWLEHFFGALRPSFAREGALRPWVDVYETEDEVVVKMEVPGVKKEDLDVTLGEREVTVKGECRKDEEVEESGYYRRERRYGQFSRSVRLPARVIPEETKARFEDGVLELRARKHPEEKQKVRKIQVE